MDRFLFYTTKIDEIHVSDEHTLIELSPGERRTLCGLDTNSANYFENDRYKNIDESRKQLRHFCPHCVLKMKSIINTVINKAQEERNEIMKNIMDTNAQLQEMSRQLELHTQLPSEPKAPVPVCVEGEYTEIFEDGPFTDGQTLEDVPKCAIPGCGSEDIKYWIHPIGKPCRYFCGDCPQSQIEILDKFAGSIGEEVCAYDAPIWAVKVLHINQKENARTVLIKAHNMAAAIARATAGDYDIESDPRHDFVQGGFVPIDIREANEDEIEELDCR